MRVRGTKGAAEFRAEISFFAIAQRPGFFAIEAHREFRIRQIQFQDDQVFHQLGLPNEFQRAATFAHIVATDELEVVFDRAIFLQDQCAVVDAGKVHQLFYGRSFLREGRSRNNEDGQEGKDAQFR